MISRVLILAVACLPVAGAQPLRLAIAGLVHGHVDGFFRAARNRTDVEIAGIFDPDRALHQKYGKKYGFPDKIFFTDLGRMLEQVKPEAVASFTDTYDHPMVVEACAAHRTHVMMEKPLAAGMEHARAIERAAKRGSIHVIVNYETTWYPSHREIWKLVHEQHTGGSIRKMVAMDGHSGPREIGVPPEFFGWLTDPVRNGAGALFDFGCYGANLMTWLMDNQRPLSVTALTLHNKPSIYPKVDDDATILVEYPKAQGIIQGSWNWPFSRKDFEVYTERAYTIADGGQSLRVRLPDAKEETRSPAPLPADEKDSISYLTAIVRGRLKPAGLSSLENNLIVTEILEAGRRSAQSGERVTLPRN